MKTLYRTIKPLLISTLLLTFYGCKSNLKEAELKPGIYRAEIIFNAPEANYSLPFTMKIEKVDSDFNIALFNGSEKIEMQNVTLKSDSLFFETPIFLTQFAAKITETGLIGEWVKLDRETENKYQFRATHGVTNRFDAKAPNDFLSGKYKTIFSFDNQFYPAIGEFEFDGEKLLATFLTETGDYRFLEGVLDEDSLKFSGFDGSHAYLFLAKFKGDSIQGIFKASHNHIENFMAVKNDTFQLANPDSLTFLKEGFAGVNFTFPNLNGDSISLSDEVFKNKVAIVQISGSWCPNCMDETKFLVELYNTHHASGLEVVSLFFERTSDFEKSVKAITRLKNHFEVPYPMLYAGSKDRENTAKALPMLNKIMSFPTLIFINKKGEVVRIHTGFAGPGTSAYNNFVINTVAYVEDLLKE